MAFDMDEVYDNCLDEMLGLQNLATALESAGAKSKRGRTDMPHNHATKVGGAKRGRPKGSKSAMKGVAVVMKKAAKKGPGKGKLSEAGRKAISDAMKARWAARK